MKHRPIHAPSQGTASFPLFPKSETERDSKMQVRFARTVQSLSPPTLPAPGFLHALCCARPELTLDTLKPLVCPEPPHYTAAPPPSAENFTPHTSQGKKQKKTKNPHLSAQKRLARHRSLYSTGAFLRHPETITNIKHWAEHAQIWPVRTQTQRDW